MGPSPTLTSPLTPKLGVEKSLFEIAQTGAAHTLSHDKAGNTVEQGHHHNGDQAARRPLMMCSICVRRSTTTLFGVRGADRADLIQ